MRLLEWSKETNVLFMRKGKVVSLVLISVRASTKIKLTYALENYELHIVETSIDVANKHTCEFQGKRKKS